MAKKIKLDGSDIIIIVVDQLPQPGQSGVWYQLTSDDQYYYWNGSSYVNSGGDRPTKPPPNP